MANPGTRTDAFPAFHFEVDIGGTSYPFRSCTGLHSETKVFEVEEGGVNTHVHKLVGPTSFPNLCLRQGFCNPASPLYALYQAFIANGGTKKRFDGFVRQIGPNGTSAKWVFKQGWISKWSGPELDATKNEVSIESIEIVHEGLQLIGSGSGTNSKPRDQFGATATLFGQKLGGPSSSSSSTSSSSPSSSSSSSSSSPAASTDSGSSSPSAPVPYAGPDVPGDSDLT